MKPDFQINSLESLSKEEKKKLFDFYNENLPQSPWSHDYLESFFSAKDNDLICLTMKKESDFVGLILGSCEKKNFKRIILRALMVKKEFRKMGYATNMVNIFLKKAFEEFNADNVYLTFRESKNLENFYEKLGFSKILEHGEYSDGEEKIYMEIKNNS